MQVVRLLLRIPISLHQEVARLARAEGVSVNQFVFGALAGAVSWRARDSAGDEGVVGVEGAGQARDKDEWVWDIWRERLRGY